jgi:hypothetical protein
LKLATVEDIIDEVRVQLNDLGEDVQQWSGGELLQYVNAAARQIVSVKPEANVVEELVDTSPDFRQVLPAGGVKFLGVWNSEDAYGVLRGSSITAIELDSMNSAFPSWMPDYPASGEYEHFAHDPRDPKVFYLFPKIASATALVKYVKNPAAVTAVEDEFSLGDEYVNAAVSYVLYRALTKNARHSVQPNQRVELWENFLRMLGVKIQSTQRVDPATNRPPGDQHG